VTLKEKMKTNKLIILYILICVVAFLVPGCRGKEDETAVMQEIEIPTGHYYKDGNTEDEFFLIGEDDTVILPLLMQERIVKKLGIFFDENPEGDKKIFMKETAERVSKKYMFSKRETDKGVELSIVYLDGGIEGTSSGISFIYSPEKKMIFWRQTEYLLIPEEK